MFRKTEREIDTSVLHVPQTGNKPKGDKKKGLWGRGAYLGQGRGS